MTDIEFVKKNYNKLGPVATADAIGRNISTVWAMAQRCGVSKMRGSYRDSSLRAEMRSVLPELVDSMSNSDIAELFGVSVMVVKHDLNVLGITRNDPWAVHEDAIHSAIYKARETSDFPIRVLKNIYPDTYRTILQTFSENALKKKIQREAKNLLDGSRAA